ncbi:ABC transporter ATP-binding protein [Nocardioides speluncae]|uniref:ABC transporter ATP-binding protein n=1 Tax=Nocardioides speluncae TaxID=2670337 RepID=UPI000D6973A7|nr:ABC transporter ATP-binding protein [Nocardioides speluncae]
MSVVLEARGLGKRYRSNWALRDCDIELPSGRVIALVGPNGAGKTTFLRLATGLLRPTTGTVTVLGAEATADSAEAHAQVGFVAQDHPLYKRFSVADLLRMGRELNRTWDQDWAVRRITALDIPLTRRAGELSGGQQSQVALALALAKRPRLLVLDEPLASLDPLARREFMQTLMSAVAEPMSGDEELTVLLSSHNVADLERVCDHLVIITDGRVQLAGDIEDLLAEHRVLSGPNTGVLDHADSAHGDSTIHATRGDRQVHVVVRNGGTQVMPGWESHPIGLEELVLAYLSRSKVGDEPVRRPEVEEVRS